MDEWMNIPTNYVQNVIFKLKIKNILIAWQMMLWQISLR
jgi:hypothetical protein